MRFTMYTIALAVLSLQVHAATPAPQTTTDNDIIAIQYNNISAIKIAPRGEAAPNEPCASIGKGGLRYNNNTNEIEYCDGIIWQEPSEYSVALNVESNINYPTLIRANSDYFGNSLVNVYSAYGDTGGPYNIHLACPINYVYVGSDTQLNPMPSSYRDAACAALILKTPQNAP